MTTRLNAMLVFPEPMWKDFENYLKTFGPSDLIDYKEKPLIDIFSDMNNDQRNKLGEFFTLTVTPDRFQHIRIDRK